MSSVASLTSSTKTWRLFCPSTSLILDAQREARHFNLAYLQLRLLSLLPLSLAFLHLPAHTLFFQSHITSDAFLHPLPPACTPFFAFFPHSRSGLLTPQYIAHSPLYVLLLALTKKHEYMHTHTLQYSTPNKLLHLLAMKTTTSHD